MRVLLDGQFFATADSLEVIAEIADVDVSRLSFHPDDLAEQEERAAEEEFERQMLAEYSSVTEMVADLVADNRKAQRAREKLAELEQKRGGP